MNILQFSTFDQAGGAERIAMLLHQGFRDCGHSVRMVVKKKETSDPHVVEINHDDYRSPRVRAMFRATEWLGRLEGKHLGATALKNALRMRVIQPERWSRIQAGLEDFDFPGTLPAIKIFGSLPDVVSFHNLHGNYFDLSALPELSKSVPLLLTLHDEWTYTGHCGYSLDCSGWLTACGKCPDLFRPPGILRDGTAANLGRKRDIWRQTKLHIVTPSQWLMERSSRSILSPAVASSSVIPYGVDTAVFSPSDKLAARTRLGLPLDGKVVLFVANKGTGNPYKDGITIRRAVAIVAAKQEFPSLTLLVVGGDQTKSTDQLSNCISVPYQRESSELACYYQAADIYLHAAHGDNFPVVVLEALACGTPVVATSVGGIPEQVQQDVTGFLTPAADHTAMAEAISRLLLDDNLCHRMATAARCDALARFSLERMVSNYLDLYRKISAQNL